MTQPTKGRKCSHPQCRCMVPGTAPYCSDHCMTAPPEDPCLCGHEECVRESHAESVQSEGTTAG